MALELGIHRGGVAPVASETGTEFEDGIRAVLLVVGVGAEVRLESNASFLRREARRPRMLDTTINITSVSCAQLQNVKKTYTSVPPADPPPAYRPARSSPQPMWPLAGQFATRHPLAQLLACVWR